MKKVISTIYLLAFVSLPMMLAQTENSDFLHSTGKINSVIGVIALIFVGIIVFLVYLERKLTKLESQIEP